MDLTTLKYIAIGFMAFGMFGAALGVGNIFAALINSIARNPSAETKIAKYAFIGGAMAEAMGIFALLVVLLLMYS